ncbi:helicase-exonuclease AddAB subunit AddB [Ureibacillus thermophilus]|uniref:ATP-dependent helicase/deoxyribonuclease subunit B n=1 Tax=Ureibacillus thermophilus TaxID=367743 RepID=A0A4P6UQZ9_9BACL|nr:helicase-exonuclease AddAB subunit AddB [Ureibacillus thermophilus]QBK25404.1 helicase-exonuclease AddAB subunit AddB [Ureibacillus thermophilus]
MSLRIISGRAGTGKTTFIHKEIVEEVKANPFGSPIFLIVPDQMSFSTEYQLTNHYGIQGLIRAQVMTFKRLSWHILQETGGIAKDKVDKIGYRMLLRRLLEENKDQFSLFRQAADKRGFTEEIEKMIREFNQFNIDSQTLEEAIKTFEQSDAPQTLIAKSKDLNIILQKLEEILGDRYIEGDGLYPFLIQQMKNSEKLKDTHVYIDGFTFFTVREFEIVKQLLTLTKRVTVVLPFENENDKDNEQAVFYRASLMYDKLRQEAVKLGIEVEPRIHMQTTYRYQNFDLQHIEQEFHQPVPKKLRAEGFVQIIEGANRRAEVHGIAREIKRLVQEEGVRYRDIGIMYRQADVYDPLISTIFAQYDIPVFTNEKKPMLHHPLIEFSRSILEVITSNWKYEPIFRSVKTDLFFPLNSDVKEMREKADVFENFVIAQGIYGNRWMQDERWIYKKYRGFEFVTTKQTDEELKVQAIIDEMKEYVRKPLLKFERELKKARNGKEIAFALFSCMDELQVFEKLQALKEKEMEKGRLEEAMEHDQAWNEWVNVLEQFVVMFGDQSLPLEDAAKILDEGYDALAFSKIPPAIDEVTVSQLEFSRFDNMKVVFVIGVNDGVYPMRIDYEGLINDMDREWFSNIDIELLPTSKHRLMEENFYIYRAFSSPTHRLYVTYSASDEESKALLPSLYVQRLHNLFEVNGESTLPHHRIFIDPIEEWEKSKILSYLRHPRTSLAYLMTQLKQADGLKLDSEWKALKAFYEQSGEWKPVLELVMKPLKEKKHSEPLKQALTEELYGDEMTSSVSRIEKYFSCPFAHFATYGLHLQERPEFRLETFEMGDLFHEALKWISMETNRLNLPWNKLTREQCAHLAREAVERIVPAFSHQILLSSSRYRYIQRKLMRIIERTMIALSQHAKSSFFKPIAVEAAFGPKEQLPPLEIPLKGGRRMKLRGRIDRIDHAKVGEKSYLRVIDYKSSGRDLDLNEVYYGISLQLLTYLDVAVENSFILLKESALPAGVLYVHVQNPLLKVEKELNDLEFEEERLKMFKMKGLLAEDQEAVIAMDERLEEDGKSIIIPASFTKKQEFAKTSKVVPPDAMQDLRKFVRRKHQEAGESILSGDTSIRPFKLKDKTACDYCQFKSVCQFDPAEDAYLRLEVDKMPNVIEKIRRELKEDESDSY